MSIWEAFGMGRYKGFSREAGLLLDEAVELAGGFGCKKADTGHLLLAMLQTDRGAAGRFLAGKNITELAVRRQLAEDRPGPVQHLDRRALAPDLRRAMDYALIGAQNAHQPRAEPEHLLCAMLEDTDCAAGVLLASMGVQLTDAVRECRQLSGQFILPSQPRASAMPRGSRASDKYCRDLTRRAAERRAGPGVLPGKGTGPDGGDPVPPPEEQPLSGGGAGRGQDGAGRRAGPAHCSPRSCAP